MQRETCLMGNLCHLLCIGGIQYSTTTTIMGILKNNQACFREMDILHANGVPNILQSQAAIRLVGQGMRENTTQC